jgi:hypothetical protein
MPVFFRMGKQRYCQGLPLLASMVVVPGNFDELPEGIILESSEEGLIPDQLYTLLDTFLSNGCPTAVVDLDTKDVPEGVYTLVASDRSAVSSPLMILTQDTYAQLLQEENRESFDEELIPASEVYRLVEDIISEYWTRVESIPALFSNRVMRGALHPSLLVTGQAENADKQISVAKLRYGCEAIISDLSYLAAVPLVDDFRSEKSALDVRVDQRGNILLYARTEVGVTQPDQILDALRLYSDVTQLRLFHPAVFTSQIELSGVNMFELSVTVNAESEKGRHAEQENVPLESAGGSAVREREYATN